MIVSLPCDEEKRMNNMAAVNSVPVPGHSDIFSLMNRYAHPQEQKKVE